MFNFRFCTDRTEVEEIWTTEIDGPNLIRTNFIRIKPQIVRSVNGAIICVVDLKEAGASNFLLFKLRVAIP